MKSIKKVVFLRLDERLVEKVKQMAGKQNRSMNNMAEVIFERAADEEEANEITEEQPA